MSPITARDPPLTAAGTFQASKTGLLLASRRPVVAVFTSPFLRCVQTAQGISRACDDAPVHVMPELQEWLSSRYFKARPSTLPVKDLKKHADNIDENLSANYDPSSVRAFLFECANIWVYSPIE